MRSVFLVMFGLLVLSLAWWWQQREMPSCCLQPVAPVIVEREPKTAPVAPVEKPIVLDLSLPSDVVSDDPLPAADEGRFGVEQWFQPKEKTESSIKFKSKLLMKEGVELQPDIGNYQDAIDGAEMGIEYKTR